MPCNASRARDRPRAFEVQTARAPFDAAPLVIATGGLSVPKIGATPFGYTWRAVRPAGGGAMPALVPLDLCASECA